MRKFVSLFIILSAITLSLCAQPQGQGWSRNHPNENGARRAFDPAEFDRNMKEFIKNEAHLTQQEADKFFPLFTEMLDKQHKLMEKKYSMMRGKNGANLTEADYQRIVESSTEMEVESAKIEQQYCKKFHTVLSWKKVAAVRWAHARFQRVALNMFAPRGPQGGPGNQGGRPGGWGGQKK